MYRKIFTGYIYSGELCNPIKNVEIDIISSGEIIEKEKSNAKGEWKINRKLLNSNIKIVFRNEKYIQKTYTGNSTPELVRLLENKLIGYQNGISYIGGQVADVFVNSNVPYRARLFRHGLKKQMILDFGVLAPQLQSLPDTYFVEWGLDWNKSFGYRVPSDAKPGLYSLLLESEQDEPFAIPMIVATHPRERGRRSRMLLISSTNNWMTYNLWGGRSRYRNFEAQSSSEYISLKSPKYLMTCFKRTIYRCLSSKIRNTISGVLRTNSRNRDWRFKRLSIKRPITNCSLEDNDVMNDFTNHLAASEWRVIAWLEREGIDFDITSCEYLDKEPHMLKNYHSVMLTSHSEYWTKNMYFTIKQNHNECGLWIFNISGNTMFRLVSIDEDGSVQCESLSFQADCEDESQLIGVRFDEKDYGSCAPFQVCDPHHWVFEGIRLPINGQFGARTLNRNTKNRFQRYDPGRCGLRGGMKGEGASGWETDKLTDSAPADFHLLAKGTNRNGGADLVFREPDGHRGGVFSASSITYGGCLLIDDVASSLTKKMIDASFSS